MMTFRAWTTMICVVEDRPITRCMARQWQRSAGDGLQAAAFETMNHDMLLYFDDPAALKKRIRASYEISKGAGCRGMVAGQVADMEAEDKNCSQEMIDYIHLTRDGCADRGGGPCRCTAGKLRS